MHVGKMSFHQKSHVVRTYYESCDEVVSWDRVLGSDEALWEAAFNG